MKNVFYAIIDEEGNYVDEDCIYYDENKKQLKCLCYPDFINYILLKESYGMATRIKTNIEQVCQKYNIHKRFSVKEIVI